MYCYDNQSATLSVKKYVDESLPAQLEKSGIQFGLKSGHSARMLMRPEALRPRPSNVGLETSQDLTSMSL